MLSLALITVLDNLRASGCRICLFGDWAQLPVVGQSWRGKNLCPKIFEGSALLKRWAGGTLFQLTTCHRSDADHYAFYTSLPDDLPTAIAWTRAAYKQSSDAQLHLVVSHRRRRALNEQAQKEFAHGLASVVIVSDDPTYACCVGTPLVGSCTAMKFVNGAFYLVESIGEKIAVRDTLTDQVITCTPEVLGRHTCLGWALTFHRCQGMSTTRRVCMHDMDSKFFTMAHLYVGISRVVDGSLVSWA
jgi:hypothetical protein